MGIREGIVMLYFRHDIGAFRDSKVQALRIECGGAAVDAYYAIVEMIYERETDLVLFGNQAETKSVSYWLCLETETLRAYVEKMGEVGLLDVRDGGEGALVLGSARAERTIDEFHARSETARQNGRKGGRPKGSKTKGKPTETNSVSFANQEQTERKTKEKEKEVSNDTSKKSRQFSKPTVGEIAAYAAERGARGFDAQYFFDHYEANGWTVGKAKMRDWRATVRNWLRRDGAGGGGDANAYSGAW